MLQWFDVQKEKSLLSFMHIVRETSFHPHIYPSSVGNMICCDAFISKYLATIHVILLACCHVRA